MPGPGDLCAQPGRIGRCTSPADWAYASIPTSIRAMSLPANYDSLLAKLIVHGEDRAAGGSSCAALFECVVEGIKTNIDFHRRLCDHEDFLRARLDTRFVERILH